jgi:hypothetical protein
LENLWDSKRPADLHQLAPANHDLPPERHRIECQEQRGSVVVDNQRVMIGKQQPKKLVDLGTTLTAPARAHIEFEIAITAGSRSKIRNGVIERRAAEVGVDHDSCRVDHAAGPRPFQRVEPSHTARGQGVDVNRGSRVLSREGQLIANNSGYGSVSPTTARLLQVRVSQEPIDRGQSASRIGGGVHEDGY